MKKIIYSIIGLAFLSSCQGNEEGNKTLYQDAEMTLSAVVDGYRTRGIGNNFFEEGHGIDVTIKTSTNPTEQNFVYEYHNDGTFKGVPTGFRFLLDDTYITNLTAIWPTKDVRDQGFATDQRKLVDYQRADWMTAVASVEGVMPTHAPVPLNFFRENTMLEFEIAGQSSRGMKITSLLFELRDDATDKPIAYWAYCGNESGHATLILEKGTRIESPDLYLIGTLRIDDGEECYIIFPETDITLEAGTRYLITLTPQGYDISAFVFIAGFQQTENGIGIPFSPPVPAPDGTFTIQTPEQLIAMSYLIRHYWDPSITFDWRDRTYIISPDLVLSAQDAANYIMIPRTMFSGQILLDDQPVTSLPYGEGSTLELFDMNN